MDNQTDNNTPHTEPSLGQPSKPVGELNNNNLPLQKEDRSNVGGETKAELNNKKYSFWKIFYIGFSLLQLTGIASIGILYLSSNGKPGSEFLPILLLFYLMPLCVIAVINIIGIPIVIIKQKVRGLVLATYLVTFITSVLLIGCFLLLQLGLRRGLSNLNKSLNSISQQNTGNIDGSSLNGADESSTKREVLDLLQNCKVDYFVGYQNNIDSYKDKNTKDWLTHTEQTKTGLSISKTGSQTYIFASKKMTADLLQEAKDARQSCYNIKKLIILMDGMLQS